MGELLRKGGKLAALSLATFGAFGQSVNTFMEGTVTDPSSAALAQATVLLKDQGTRAIRQTTTDEHGFFHFLSLPSGAYTITVSAQGFKSSVISTLVIVLNEMRYVPVELQLGSASESISVSDDSTPVEVASSVKIRERARFKFNAFNDTQNLSLGTAAAFGPAGVNTTASFGFPTASRPARILASSLRFEF